jgi:hypothetical protein
MRVKENILTLNNFLKGLISRVADDLIPENAMADCLNVDMTQSDVVKSIKGFKRYNQAVLGGDSGGNIQGAIILRYESFEYVIAVCGGRFYWTKLSEADFKPLYVDGETNPDGSPKVAETNTDSEFEMVQYNQQVFCVNGRDNVITNLDGLPDTNLGKMAVIYRASLSNNLVIQDISRVPVSPDVSVNLEFIPRGLKYLVIHNERLFGAQPIDDANGLYWSEPYNPFNWNAVSGANFDSVGRDDGEIIMGLASFNENYMYVFKPHNVYRYYTVGQIDAWGSNRLDTRYGCIAHRTIKLLDGSLFYLSQDGVASLNGNQVVLIGENIRDKFANAVISTEGLYFTKYSKGKNGFVYANKLNGTIANAENITAFRNFYQGLSETGTQEKKYSFLNYEKKSTDTDLFFVISENRLLLKADPTTINCAEISTPSQTNYFEYPYTPFWNAHLAFMTRNTDKYAETDFRSHSYGMTITPTEDIAVNSFRIKLSDYATHSPNYNLYISAYLNGVKIGNNITSFSIGQYLVFNFPLQILKGNQKYELNIRLNGTKHNNANWDNGGYFLFKYGASNARYSFFYIKNLYPNTPFIQSVTYTGGTIHSGWSVGTLPDIVMSVQWFRMYETGDTQLQRSWLRFNPNQIFIEFSRPQSVFYTSESFDIGLMPNTLQIKQKLKLELKRTISNAPYSIRLTVANYNDNTLTFDQIPATNKQTYNITNETGDIIDLNVGNFVQGFYYKYLKYKIEFLNNDSQLTIDKIRFFYETQEAEDMPAPVEYISEPVRLTMRTIENWGNLEADITDTDTEYNKVKIYLKQAVSVAGLEQAQWQDVEPNTKIPLLPNEANPDIKDEVFIQVRTVMNINSTAKINKITLNFDTTETDIYPCAIVWKGQYILNINDGEGGTLNNVSYVYDNKGYWVKRDLETNVIYFAGVNNVFSGDNQEGIIWEDNSGYTNNGISYESSFTTKRFRFADVENLFDTIKLLYKSEMPITIGYSIDEGGNITSDIENNDYHRVSEDRAFVEFEVEGTPLGAKGQNRLSEIREILQGLNSGQTIQFRFRWNSNEITEIHRFELIWSTLRQLDRR